METGIVSLLFHPVTKDSFNLNENREIVSDYADKVKSTIDQKFLRRKYSQDIAMQDFYWSVFYLAEKPVEKFRQRDLNLLRRSIEAIYQEDYDTMEDLEQSLLNARKIYLS
jgi:hypothetical protein